MIFLTCFKLQILQIYKYFFLGRICRYNFRKYTFSSDILYLLNYIFFSVQIIVSINFRQKLFSLWTLQFLNNFFSTHQILLLFYNSSMFGKFWGAAVLILCRLQTEIVIRITLYFTVYYSFTFNYRFKHCLYLLIKTFNGNDFMK